MSFATYARKVRNPALPHGRRVQALRSCVQLYAPIGFRASLSFLEEIAGPFQYDEAALLRALDALTRSREAWHADVQQYAAIRRRAKRLGHRSPRPADRNPSNRPDHWYGAPRQAALHALLAWQRWGDPYLPAGPDPAAEAVSSCMAAAIASGGELTPGQRQLLADSIADLERRISPKVWPEDTTALHRAWRLLRLARVVATADGLDVRAPGWR